MLYALLLFLLICSTYLTVRRIGAKKLFNIPWYYRIVSLDIGGKKGKLYEYNGVRGIPDGVFKHILLPRYIVGELKGRKLNNGMIRGYEYGQILLYIGILKKKYWLSSVEGRLGYKDSVKIINWDKTLFNDIMDKKRPALRVINQLHRNR